MLIAANLHTIKPTSILLQIRQEKPGPPRDFPHEIIKSIIA